MKSLFLTVPHVSNRTIISHSENESFINIVQLISRQGPLPSWSPFKLKVRQPKGHARYFISLSSHVPALIVFLSVILFAWSYWRYVGHREKDSRRELTAQVESFVYFPDTTPLLPFLFSSSQRKKKLHLSSYCSDKFYLSKFAHSAVFKTGTVHFVWEILEYLT